MKTGFERIEWRSGEHFWLDGVEFVCPLTSGDIPETRADRFAIFKNKAALDSYIDIFGDARFDRILEFGVHQGGSAMLFAMLCAPKKLIGVELSPRHEAFEAARAAHPFGERVKIYWETSQDAAEPLARIMDEEFGAEPIDLIVDDAGHMYEPARRAFELSFARLRPGGFYVVEDWGWAHWRTPAWQDNPPLKARPAFTNLIFELIMACASSPNLIERVVVLPWAAFVKKSPGAGCNRAVISMTDSYVMQGRTFTRL